MSEVTCPACGHKATVDADPAASILRCDVCDARIVYGQLGPRVVVEPSTFDSTGAPAVLVRIQDPIARSDVHVAKLDPQYAFYMAQAVISMVRP